MQVIDLSNLLKDNTFIMKYWDYKKNMNNDLDKLTIGSNKKVWWICEKGHSYDQVIRSKVKGIGCPICSNKKVLKGYNDLATTNPELLKEWNYDKNVKLGLNPESVTKGGEKKVWWICPTCKETYECMLYSKRENVGCPYCSNKTIKKGLNDIFTINPSWKKYWDYKENEKRGINPYKLSRNSHIKASWICSICEKKFVRSLSKTKNVVLCSDCSINNGVTNRIKTYTEKYGSLSEMYPEIAKEWDYEKNGVLKPNDVTSHSSQKVWWICPNGHSYKSSISHKVNGRGCPKCSKEKSISFPEKAIVYYLNKVDKEIIESYQPDFLNGKEIDIFIKNKNIGIEFDGAVWHKDISRDLEKNKMCFDNGITLYRIRESKCPVLNSTSKDIYVKMNDNYKSLDIIIFKLIKRLYDKEIIVDINQDRMEILKLVSYTIKQRSLESLFPEISKEWDYEKNKGLLPSQFYATSSRKVWWICPKGHSYDCTISHRTTDNNGCPYCSNQKVLKGYNDLATTNPKLLKEWNYEKNNKNGVFPYNVFQGTHKKVWWICEKGHEWEASISNKNRRGCPVCSNALIVKGVNDITTTHKKILSMWDFEDNSKNNVFPENFSYGSSQKVWWICPLCGNKWQQRINHIVNGVGCPKCKSIKISQKLSKKIVQYSTDGKKIKQYDSLTQAELETGINRSNICKACKDVKYTAGGFIWKYK